MAQFPLPADAAPAAVDDDVLAQIALSRREYELACEMLGRAPSDVELGMIGALWSEHCGYKHSRPLFHHFPTEDERILTNLGEENAGAIDIGGGWVAVMKIESHNHPSAIEPYEGAATGVGGIVRDIFAMGAQPIALLDSLRFGPLEDRRNRRLCVGVVAGIGGYGNCLGIPTVGGELVIGDSYSGNPLVNAMCLGIAPRGALISATAGPPGTQLMIVGADTGRDGLHGATFASVELDESSAERRPAVQVGNPFLEKSLMDACVGLVRDHRDWLEGLQDCGAAGITSSTVEMAERANAGIRIQTQHVPQARIGHDPIRSDALRVAGTHDRRRQARSRRRRAGLVRALGPARRGDRRSDGRRHRPRPRRRSGSRGGARLGDDQSACLRALRRARRQTRLRGPTGIRRRWPIWSLRRPTMPWCDCWPRRTSPRSAGSIGSTTTWSGPTPWLRLARTPQCCGFADSSRVWPSAPTVPDEQSNSIHTPERPGRSPRRPATSPAAAPVRSR